MRQSIMRRVFAIALPFLALACTPVGPEPKTLEPAKIEAAPTVELAPTVPDEPEEPVDPKSQPRLEVVARTLSPEELDESEGLCPFEVRQHAFPAISKDGTTLVAALTIGMNRVNAETYLELSWFDINKPHTDEPRIVSVYNHGGAEMWPKDPPDCDVAITRVRDQVAALNRELATHTWRALEPLEVLYSKPDSPLQRVPEEIVNVDELLTSLPAADRPLEVFYNGGHFIARVRALRVVQKTPRPDWQQFGDEFCATAPQISAIMFHRATKLGLVSYNYNNSGCLCDGRSRFGRIELSGELLAEAELRSNDKYLAAFDAAMAAYEAGVE
jgi:hypothetical protein